MHFDTGGDQLLDFAAGKDISRQIVRLRLQTFMLHSKHTMTPGMSKQPWLVNTTPVEAPSPLETNTIHD